MDKASHSRPHVYDQNYGYSIFNTFNESSTACKILFVTEKNFDGNDAYVYRRHVLVSLSETNRVLKLQNEERSFRKMYDEIKIENINVLKLFSTHLYIHAYCKTK